MLRALAGAGRPITAAEVTRETGIPGPTVARLLVTLNLGLGAGLSAGAALRLRQPLRAPPRPPSKPKVPEASGVTS